MACQLAVSRNKLSEQELQQIISLLQRFSLPVLPPASMAIADFMPYMKTDKKVKAGTMRFILPTAFCQTAIVDDVTEAELLEVFANGTC